VHDLIKQQWAIQHYAFNYELDRLTPEARIAYIKEMMLGIHNELHEALNETGWKDWSTGRHLHVDLYLNELVDAQLMLWNLMLATGLMPDELSRELVERIQMKQKLNIQRQENGY
jgi:hypothetical protein